LLLLLTHLAMLTGCCLAHMQTAAAAAAGPAVNAIVHISYGAVLPHVGLTGMTTAAAAAASRSAISTNRLIS
jgi:hypothetical protein